MPKNINGVGKVYTIQEIMELLDVSDVTVRRYYRKGKLKGQKFGKHIYFTETALKDFLEGKTTETKSEKKDTGD